MLTLKTFGVAQLFISNQKHPFKTAWPFTIAAYTLIEHNGHATYQQLKDRFYPNQPLCPENFSPLACSFYRTLWKEILTGPESPDSPHPHCPPVSNTLNADYSQNSWKEALQQLQRYQLIDSFEITTTAYSYIPSKEFCAYLQKLGLGHGTQKTLNVNLSNIKKKVGQEHCLIEQSSVKFTQFEIDIVALEQALQNCNFNEIKRIYTGPFLSDLEKEIRKGVWMPPLLLDWIWNKRQYFAQQISDSLDILLKDFPEQSTELTQEIQMFREQHKLFSNQHVQQRSTPNPPTPTPSQPVSTLPPYSATFPHSIPSDNTSDCPQLRIHLFRKMTEECEIRLDNIRQHWINLRVSAKKTRLDKQTSFLFQTDQLLDFLEDCGGFAVLLGEGGIGKSIALYDLAQRLLERAKTSCTFPIPLIFNLANWTKNQSLPVFLQEELLLRFGLSEEGIEQEFALLLKNKAYIFLLDGFDNIPIEYRLEAFSKIQQFIQKKGEVNLGGILLASRPVEYCHTRDLFLAEDTQTFRFYGEVALTELDQEHVENYLKKYPNLSVQKLELLFHSTSSHRLLNTPLRLTLFLENFDPSSLTEHIDHKVIEQQLISSHVNKLLDRAEQDHQAQKSPYTRAQVKTWLQQIACSVKIGETFRTEALSPTILNTHLQRLYTRWFALFFGMIFGSIHGAAGGLIFGKRMSQEFHQGLPAQYYNNSTLNFLNETLRQWMQSDMGLEKLYLVITYSAFGLLCGTLASILTLILFKKIFISSFLFIHLTLFLGLTGLIAEGMSWGLYMTLLYGSLGAFLGQFTQRYGHPDPLQIDLSQNVSLNYSLLYKKMKTSLPIFLIMAIIGVLISLPFTFSSKLTVFELTTHGLFIGLCITLTHLFATIKREGDWSNRLFLTRQKIGALLITNLLNFLIISLLITTIVTFFAHLIFRLDWTGSFSLGIRIGVPIGLIIGFIVCKGTEILKHLTLRWIMYQQNLAPWRYSTFLRYMTQVNLLRLEVGGGVCVSS